MAYVRAWVAVALPVTWSPVAATGFLLWLAPDGPRSGRILGACPTIRHEESGYRGVAEVG